MDICEVWVRITNAFHESSECWKRILFFFFFFFFGIRSLLTTAQATSHRGATENTT
jgi:hypothetical protein